MSIPRMTPHQAHEKATQGEALLVCAYDDEEKCRDVALAGSIPLTGLREEDVPAGRSLIFYCA